ncbi:hypothetical protein DdX_10744 [Ditylenchus destructor]|uniref:Uncharacterized protein n=1 Tax=Ditylenchus destructor TaxID=166010 RepID=A0AAD4MZG7_9BILA|nr:hypothetical protein DdX_10744 [Ditylenchus destructor]
MDETEEQMLRSNIDESENVSSLPEKKIDIHAGVEYTVKKSEIPSGQDAAKYYASKLGMSDVTSISITTPGQLDRLGRKYVCERAVGTTVTHLDEGIATGSCSTAEIGTQYEHQKLTNDAIQRICASKKMAKFLKSVVPIMEEELQQNITLSKILW